MSYFYAISLSGGIVNKELFKPLSSTEITTNLAGGNAFKLKDKKALTIFAMTGTFAGTAYSTPKDVLNNLKEMCDSVNDIEFISNLAVYSRQKGCMKDMPSFLLGYVFANDKDNKYFASTFESVVDSGKMLCNFWQITRANTFGRKNISSSKARKAIQKWFDSKSDMEIYRAYLDNNNPSLGDVIKAARPIPNTPSKSALFNYMIGKKNKINELSNDIKAIVEFQNDITKPMPKAPFLALSSLSLSNDQWKELMVNCSWKELRKNLNTFKRHNVFDDLSLVDLASKRLSDHKSVIHSKAMPYEILNAYLHSDEMPTSIRNSLHIAMDYSLENTPEFDGNIALCVDTSGSMSYHVMSNGKHISKIRYVDIAALFASAVMKKNKNSDLFLFDTKLHKHNVNSFDSVITNATKIEKYGGGGTDCSIPLKHILKTNKNYDVIIFISDNESWFGETYYGTTGHQKAWEEYSKSHKNTKLVCIDISPTRTSQTKEDSNVLNVSGFNDNVFKIIKSWLELQE